MQNNTPHAIRALLYPVVRATAVLGDSADDDVFVSGMMGGHMIRKPGESFARYPGMDVFRLQHPGLMSLQLQAFYDDTAGLVERQGAAWRWRPREFQTRRRLHLPNPDSEQAAPSQTWQNPYR